MSIPSYAALLRPLLACFAEDGELHHVREFYDRLAEQFHLTDEERAMLMPSGQGPLFHNRVGWARTYLKKAGLIETARRGVHRVTARGRQALGDCPENIPNEYLARFPEFVAFAAGDLLSEGRTPTRAITPQSGLSPDEDLFASYQSLRRQLVSETLERVIECSAGFFEQLVVQLLVKIGYGGSLRDAGQAVGRGGDEGIDGVIKEDRLGLDTIYLQAKKWARDRRIGRPDVQQFVGALHGKRARKGVFITTASFTDDAREYAARMDPTVILVDGDTLAELMIDHEVGVTTVATYAIKRIDSDFFDEER